jgi:hypothetical protein
MTFIRKLLPNPKPHPLFQFYAVPEKAGLLLRSGVAVLPQPLPGIQLGLRQRVSGVWAYIEAPHVPTQIEELMQCQPEEVLESVVHGDPIARLWLTRV